MKIRPLKNYNWFKDDSGYVEGQIYDVKDDLAREMVFHGYAEEAIEDVKFEKETKIVSSEETKVPKKGRKKKEALTGD